MAPARPTPRYAPRTAASPLCPAVALLLGLVCAALAPAGPEAAERDYGTILALGWIQPIQTSEGIGTPVVVIDHQSGTPDEAGELAANWYTAEGNLGYTVAVAARLNLEARTRGRYTIEGFGRDLYVDGDRDSANTFQGDSLAGILAAHLLPRSPWRLSLEAERMATRFYSHADTRGGYALPPDFRQNEARLSFARVGLLHEEAEARITVTAGEREGWGDWSLDPDADAERRYTRHEATLDQPFPETAAGRTAFTAQWLGGEDLDLFSGYAIGGLGGDIPVGGYYRNEFRARRAVLLGLSQEWRFAEDRRLTLFADGGRLRELPLDLPGYRPGERSLLGVGITGWYGIRPLFGLPLILTYAEGLIVPEDAKEGHRREVALILAAAF